MIIVNCEQGDKEWLNARAGVITASMFGECRKTVGGLDAKQEKYVEAILSGKSESVTKLIAGYKASPKSEAVKKALKGEKVGDFTEKAKQYAFKLAVERLSGNLLQEDKFETFEMRRGHELEPEARLLHEERKGILVERTGLVLTEDKCFGASVDGLIDDDGMSEYKCFISPSSLMPILLNNSIDDCIDQVQGGMWITGREYAHFMLYCPALECIDRHVTIFEVERDDDYIEEMQSDLLKFNDLVLCYMDTLTYKGAKTA
jgi:hypothetical protein